MEEVHVHLNISLTGEDARSIIEALNNSTFFDNCREKEATLYAFEEAEAEAMKYKYNERVTVGTDANGKPIIKWAVGNTKADLQESIARLKGAPFVEPEHVPEKKKLFKDYAEFWMETYRKAELSPSTFSFEQARKNRLVKAFGEMQLSSITTSDIQGLWNSMSNNKKSYIHSLQVTLRLMLDSAVQDHLLSSNPARDKRISNPGQPASERRALTDEERRKVIEGLPNIEQEKDRYFLAISFYTGIRPEEVLGLMWEDIDLENKCVHIQRAVRCKKNAGYIGETKTKAAKRYVPLPRQLLCILRPEGKTGLIFTADNESGVYSKTMKARMWRRIKKQANLSDELFAYILRHNYGTMMLEEDIDLKSAAHVMGHSTPKMLLETYSHFSNKMSEKVCRRMSSAFERIEAGM